MLTRYVKINSSRHAFCRLIFYRWGASFRSVVTRELARYRINATCINDDMQVCVNILTPLRVHSFKLYSDLGAIRKTSLSFANEYIRDIFKMAGSTKHLDLQQLMLLTQSYLASDIPKGHQIINRLPLTARSPPRHDAHVNVKFYVSRKIDEHSNIFREESKIIAIIKQFDWQNRQLQRVRFFKISLIHIFYEILFVINLYRKLQFVLAI